MMFHRESLEGLKAKLDAVDAEIASHPLSSDRVKTAQAIVEARANKDTEEVSRELADQNLPSLEELGKIQVNGTVSWWKLHRKRNNLVKKIDRSK
ncbi:hypothetical protein [Pseudarthrobacter sp. CCNWLW207]|uniref:hypothetical protein n=1 Tax=Pseudarthrobacter sp. CCNWLW207 TaxID=3127468 RepID=UPI003077BDC2